MKSKCIEVITENCSLCKLLQTNSLRSGNPAGENKAFLFIMHNAEGERERWQRGRLGKEAGVFVPCSCQQPMLE